MKKSLIALAVAAGTIAAANADTTTLYGSLGYSTVLTKAEDKNIGGSVTQGVKNIKHNVWDIKTTTAKLGVKGTEDLNNGLQAFFKYEFGIGDNNGLSETKYAYLGLKGDFGTLTIGKQDSLAKKVLDTGLFQEVDTGVDFDHISTTPKMISYVSPEAGVVQFGASMQLDGANTVSKGVDFWEVAAMYNQNGFNTGVVYSKEVESVGSSELTGVNVGYSNDTFGIVGRAAHVSSLMTHYGIEGEYYIGQNTIRAGFGLNDPKAKGEKSDYNFALGYQYNLSDRTYTWVEGSYKDYNVKGKKNDFSAVVGIRHDF